MAGATYLFYEPILAPRLEIDLGLRADLTFALLTICYAVGCIFIGKISMKHDLRYVIFGSFLASSICIYLSSGLENDSIVATLFGIAGEGFAYAGNLVAPYGEIFNVI